MSITAPRILPGRFKTALNAGSNLATILLQAGISVALAPYLIQELGIAAYGMVLLSNTFPSWIRLVTGAVTNSVFRFVALEQNEGDATSANAYYCSAVGAIVVASIPLLIVGGIVTIFFSSLFDVPLGLEQPTQWMVFLIFLAGMLGTWTAVLRVPYMLSHNFWLQNLQLLVARLIALMVLAIGFYWWGPNLVVVGAYQLCFQLVAAALVWTMQRKIQQTLRFRWQAFDWSRLKEMLSFGRWVFVNDIAVLLYLGAGLILVNLILGAESTGELGPVLLLNSLLVSIGAAIGTVLMPIYYSYLSTENNDLLSERILLGMRITGYVTGLMVLVLCGLGPKILELWLGISLVGLWPLVCLTILATWTGGICFIPAAHVLRGKNVLRPMAMWNVAFSVGHILVTVLLITRFGWGLLGFGISYVIMFGVKNVLLNAFYLGKTLGQNSWMHVVTASSMLLIMMGLSTVLYFGSKEFDTSWANLFLLILIATALYLLSCPLMLRFSDIHLMFGKRAGATNETENSSAIV